MHRPRQQLIARPSADQCSVWIGNSDTGSDQTDRGDKKEDKDEEEIVVSEPGGTVSSFFSQEGKSFAQDLPADVIEFASDQDFCPFCLLPFQLNERLVGKKRTRDDALVRQCSHYRNCEICSLLHNSRYYLVLNPDYLLDGFTRVALHCRHLKDELSRSASSYPSEEKKKKKKKTTTKTSQESIRR